MFFHKHIHKQLVMAALPFSDGFILKSWLLCISGLFFDADAFSDGGIYTYHQVLLCSFSANLLSAILLGFVYLGLPLHPPFSGQSVIQKVGSSSV